MRRALPLLLVVALLLPSLSACVTGGTGRVSPAEAAKPDRRYVGVTLNDGTEIPFDRPRGAQRVSGELRPAIPPAQVDGDSLSATVGGEPYRVALADVWEVWFDDSRISWARTGLLVGGITAAFVIAVYLAFQNADFLCDDGGENILGGSC